MKTKTLFAIIAFGAVATTAPAVPSTNSWIGGSGKWELGTNWSLGGPPASFVAAVLITNATPKVVTIDATTSGSFPGTLAMSNLEVASFGASVSALVLISAGVATPLHVFNACSVAGGGFLFVTNSAVLVDGLAGGGLTIDGDGTLASGVIVATNTASYVGFAGAGTLTVSGGTNLTSTTTLGFSPGSTGTVLVAGGLMMATNASISVGDDGVGSMTVSNGEVQALSINVGSGINVGTLTSAGGTISVSTLLVGGSGASGTGMVWLTGGTLLLTNGTVSVIGSNGVGQLTVSNGTWLAQGVAVGAGGGSQGTLAVAGGTGSVFSNMTLGNSACTSTGMVVVVGGSLFVTNTAHNAVLDLEGGTLTLSAGTLVVDILVKTNPCASFSQTGGTLVVGGVTNLSSSLFVITAISREGNNMRIGWQTPGGVTNIVQATNGGPGGSYNTNFVDLPPQSIITGVGLITTNYLDVGGATNRPARYYRVRLVP
jgi:T5SS/PEP-CTERM-associated repeat protein